MPVRPARLRHLEPWPEVRNDLRGSGTRLELHIERQGTLAVPALDNAGFEIEQRIGHLLQRHILARALGEHGEPFELADVLSIGGRGPQGHRDDVVAFTVLREVNAGQARLQGVGDVLAGHAGAPRQFLVDANPELLGLQAPGVLHF